MQKKPKKRIPECLRLMVVIIVHPLKILLSGILMSSPKLAKSSMLEIRVRLKMKFLFLCPYMNICKKYNR